MLSVGNSYRDSHCKKEMRLGSLHQWDLKKGSCGRNYQIIRKELSFSLFSGVFKPNYGLCAHSRFVDHQIHSSFSESKSIRYRQQKSRVLLLLLAFLVRPKLATKLLSEC